MLGDLLDLKIDEIYDIVVMLDVLEHIEDDRSALAKVASCISRDGLLILTVPAYGWLWSSHDVTNAHFRRYSAKQLRARLESSGFRVEQIGYMFAGLVPPKLVMRWLEMAGVDLGRFGRSRPSIVPLRARLPLVPHGGGDSCSICPNVAVWVVCGGGSKTIATRVTDNGPRIPCPSGESTVIIHPAEIWTISQSSIPPNVRLKGDKSRISSVLPTRLRHSGMDRGNSPWSARASFRGNPLFGKDEVQNVDLPAVGEEPGQGP